MQKRFWCSLIVLLTCSQLAFADEDSVAQEKLKQVAGSLKTTKVFLVEMIGALVSKEHIADAPIALYQDVAKLEGECSQLILAWSLPVEEFNSRVEDLAQKATALDTQVRHVFTTRYDVLRATLDEYLLTTESPNPERKQLRKLRLQLVGLREILRVAPSDLLDYVTREIKWTERLLKEEEEYPREARARIEALLTGSENIGAKIQKLWEDLKNYPLTEESTARLLSAESDFKNLSAKYSQTPNLETTEVVDVLRYIEGQLERLEREELPRLSKIAAAVSKLRPLKDAFEARLARHPETDPEVYQWTQIELRTQIELSLMAEEWGNIPNFDTKAGRAELLAIGEQLAKMKRSPVVEPNPAWRDREILRLERKALMVWMKSDYDSHRFFTTSHGSGAIAEGLLAAGCSFFGAVGALAGLAGGALWAALSGDLSFAKIAIPTAVLGSPFFYITGRSLRVSAQNKFDRWRLNRTVRRIISQGQIKSPTWFLCKLALGG